MNISGPAMEPWGTPHVIVMWFDYYLWIVNSNEFGTAPALKVEGRLYTTIVSSYIFCCAETFPLAELKCT